MENKLYRSRSDRMIAGVCGGLGQYLQVDPVWIRLLFVLLLFASGFGFWAYLILWIIIPEEGRVTTATGDTVQANVQDIAGRARDFGRDVQRGLGRSADGQPDSTTGAIIVGGAFILIGVVMLFNRLGLFWWLNSGILWPLLLILLGGALLYSRTRS
jgi:phage shock protein PspC (stress-responsive transcriptional regulator)